MPNKALRILIADEQHFHRMKTERLFNQLGYHRVAPVQSLVEMLTLVEYGCEPFDLVLINASLAGGALDLFGFFLDNRQVHHALIYDGRRAQLPPVSAAAGFPQKVQQRVQVSHAAQPDLASIQRLMALIDSPVCEAAPSPDHEWNRQRIG
ncbi:response regulator [Pseudomonas sp. B21-015]|uniref:response regulator n=1 Tax=Pseudomonas sp. B21-015 TaxID=2895473 RepID=UPI00215EDA9D|nr:response regulator [Pseudomonas sp. B21-015]UVM52362.1 response regulator [Pseudomonas sp. B21-015]